MDEVLGLLTAMITAPALPESALESVRSLCLQSLESLEDEPQHHVVLRLRERHHPSPFNRHGYGRQDVIEGASLEDLREAWAQRCRPGGAILAVAGAIDPQGVARRLDDLLAGWCGPHEEPVEQAAPVRGQDHLQRDTAQTHIGVAYEAPREVDPNSMRERLAVGVLSGGTSARLFTEVRQKRSLCYSVGASYASGRDTGTVSLYAGTTPQRVHETLDVCIAEIERLRDGVEPDEFARAVIGLKSHLIMQGESTSARATAIGSDHFRIRQARTLEQIARAVDAATGA